MIAFHQVVIQSLQCLNGRFKWRMHLPWHRLDSTALSLSLDASVQFCCLIYQYSLELRRYLLHHLLLLLEQRQIVDQGHPRGHWVQLCVLS